MATRVRSDERSSERLPLKLELRPVVDLQDDQFYEFCRINRDVRIERIENAVELSGDPVLSGFVLDLREIW